MRKMRFIGWCGSGICGDCARLVDSGMGIWEILTPTSGLRGRGHVLSSRQHFACIDCSAKRDIQQREVAR